MEVQSRVEVVSDVTSILIGGRDDSLEWQDERKIVTPE